MRSEVTIEPGVRKAKDMFGFGFMGFQTQKNNSPATPHDVFCTLADFAATVAIAHTERTGEDTGTADVHGVIWTANRGLHVHAEMNFKPSDTPGKIHVSLSDAERERWRRLRWAMKCFLN